MFNGYADEVGSLYEGMDLRKLFYQPASFSGNPEESGTGNSS